MFIQYLRLLIILPFLLAWFVSSMIMWIVFPEFSRELWRQTITKVTGEEYQ
jgi:hypothetical protein